MKRLIKMALVVSLLVVVLPAQAFTWGFASHAYIADELLKRWEQDDFLARNLNEIYASMSPDLMNFAFELGDIQPFFEDSLHQYFQLVVDAEEQFDAHWKELGLAYGFASHNDVWGADYTAHHSGLTYGQEVGWVIQKSEDMNFILNYDLDGTDLPPLQDILFLLGVSPEQVDAMALGLYHNFVEFSSDVLVAGLDPMIGEKMGMAVLHQAAPGNPLTMTDLLAVAYSGIIPAEVFQMIEPAFRAMLTDFGMVLTLDEETALYLTADFLADFAPSFLGVAADDLFQIMPREELVALMNGYLTVAANICRQDLEMELKATIKYLGKAMKEHDIKK